MDEVTNPSDIKFIDTALYAICEARRAVSFSYPYGYFIEHEPINNMYERL